MPEEHRNIFKYQTHDAGIKPASPKFTADEITSEPLGTAMTPKGSVTSDILAMVLKRLDDLGACERTPDGPTPMGLFDAHDSRLQLPFLLHCNTPLRGRPMWKACMGPPNVTHVWQVGGSTQQNGCLKMAMTREKDESVSFKKRMRFESIDFKWHGIAPLIHRAWAASFSRKEQNLKVTLAGGWRHLDMSLLKWTETLKTRVAMSVPSPPMESPITHLPPTIPDDIHVSSTFTTVSSVTQVSGLDTLNLNFFQDEAGTNTQDLLQHLLHKQKTHKACIKWGEEGSLV